MEDHRIVFILIRKREHEGAFILAVTLCSPHVALAQEWERRVWSESCPQDTPTLSAQPLLLLWIPLPALLKASLSFSGILLVWTNVSYEWARQCFLSFVNWTLEFYKKKTSHDYERCHELQVLHCCFWIGLYYKLIILLLGSGLLKILGTDLEILCFHYAIMPFPLAICFQPEKSDIS